MKEKQLYKYNPVLIITILLFPFATPLFGQAQDTVLLTDTWQDVYVPQILDEIAREYSLHIYYKAEWFDENYFTGSFKGVSIQEVMNKILEKTGMTSFQLEQCIYVVPREGLALLQKQMNNGNNHNTGVKDYILIGNPNEAGKHSVLTIRGIISNGADGTPLPGAVIQAENTTYYAVTGNSGNYSLQLPAGLYRIRVRSMGYEDATLDIKAITSGSLDIEVFEEIYSIEEVSIIGEQQDANVSRVHMGVLKMNAKFIKHLPSLVGEPDIIKSFATMPGVKTASEFGSGINVRGGSEDQNLFLLENSPLYNTSHVMGLLSVINPDALNNVTLYKGHIPVEYGQGISSVMDIKIADPAIDEFKLKGGIGLFSSRLLLETPLAKDLVKLKLGGRSSYSDYLLTHMPDYNLQNSSASFYDVSATVNINLKENLLTLFAYHSHDYFKYASNVAYDYNNSLFSASWTHIFSTVFFLDFEADYSSYNLASDNNYHESYRYELQTGIESLSGKIQAKYQGPGIQKLTLGMQASHYSVNPGERNPLNNSEISVYDPHLETAYEISGFVLDEITFASRFTVQLGLRYTLYNFLGPATVYAYVPGEPMHPENVSDSSVYGAGESVSKYGGLEPRLSMKYMLGKNNSIKLSYNRNKQYLTRLSYTSITTPEDVWKLSDPYLRPVIADQIALGYYQNFEENTYEFSAEVYTKYLQNLTEYRNGADLQFNPNLETELLPATGTNYGIELFLKKSRGKLQGNISYTYSRAFKQTDGQWFEDIINSNNRYPSAYDIPHALKVGLNYSFNRRVRMGCNFNYTSGRPVTLPEYTYYLEYEKLVYYSDRNKYRIPDYHRLDISLSIDESLRIKKKWKGSWTFSLLNVYGRKNAYSIFYQKDVPTEDNNYQPFSLYKMYLIGIPMPVITYNFIF